MLAAAETPKAYDTGGDEKGSIDLSVSPEPVAVGTPGTMIATVYDEEGGSASGVQVSFSPGDESASVAKSTNSQGTATHTHTYTEPGNVTASASAGGHYSPNPAIADVTVVGIEKIVRIEGSEERDGPVYMGFDQTVSIMAIAMPEDAEFPDGYPLWTIVEKPAESQLTDESLEDERPTVEFAPDFPGIYVVKAACGTSEAEITIFAIQIELVYQHRLPDYGEFCDGKSPSTDPVTVFVNRADANRNGIPDYADPNITDTGILVPLVLNICPADIDWDAVSLTFEYPGSSTLPDFSGTPILHHGSESGYHDYTAAKDGVIRVWRLPPTSMRDNDNYVEPGTVYEADELDFSGNRVFWVEGINEGAASISVTLTVDEDNPVTLSSNTAAAEVFEPWIGLNVSNSSNNKRPGISSVDFTIDEHDFMVKDQGDGFRWWWSDGKGGGKKGKANGDDFGADDLNMATIVDLAPFVVMAPTDLDTEYRIEVQGLDLEIYHAVSPSGDRRAFLQDHQEGMNQLAEQPFFASDGVPISLPVQHGLNEFVFRAIGSGVSTGYISLYAVGPGTGDPILVCSVRLTVRGLEHFWHFVSARNPLQPPMAYPTEDGRLIPVQWYGYAQPVANHPGQFDLNGSRTLVYVHGFNVNAESALNSFHEKFKRVFWLGFRGNFIGFTWRGDDGDPWQFDPNVWNAFRSAPSLRFFLRDLRSLVGSGTNIDIIAHSLGNLLVSEALRIERYSSGPHPLVHNYGLINAAVWREAFDDRGLVEYRVGNPLYVAATAADVIDYDVDQQQQQSWRFWFRQPNADIREVLSGGMLHNYVVDDDALWDKMRWNCISWRGWALSNFSFRSWHYHRDRLEATPAIYRAPSGDRSFHNVVPALLHNRRSTYDRSDLNLPAGCVPLVGVAHNVEATHFGWRHGEHSDYRVVDDDPTRPMWFPTVYDWFEEFVARVISIGVE
jgi:hypothetical protein